VHVGSAWCIVGVVVFFLGSAMHIKKPITFTSAVYVLLFTTFVSWCTWRVIDSEQASQ
jgi:hypothetical protein